MPKIIKTKLIYTQKPNKKLIKKLVKDLGPALKSLARK